MESRIIIEAEDAKGKSQVLSVNVAVQIEGCNGPDATDSLHAFINAALTSEPVMNVFGLHAINRDDLRIDPDKNNYDIEVCVAKKTMQKQVFCIRPTNVEPLQNDIVLRMHMGRE